MLMADISNKKEKEEHNVRLNVQLNEHLHMKSSTYRDVPPRMTIPPS